MKYLPIFILKCFFLYTVQFKSAVKVAKKFDDDERCSCLNKVIMVNQLHFFRLTTWWQ